MATTKSTTRRAQSIDKTISQVQRDIGASQHDSGLPPFDKLIALVGKPVSLSPSIIESNENIRKDIGKHSESFENLKDSIQTHGVLQSILVEIRGDASAYKLMCVEGHRRLAISNELNLPKIPCLLSRYEKAPDRIKAALATSLKEDLNPIDRAEAFDFLLTSGISIEDIAQHEKKDVRTLRRYLKMAKWPVETKEIIRANNSVFSTRFLFQNLAQTDLPAAEIMKVIQAKLQVDGIKAKGKAKRALTDDEKFLKERLADKLGVPVSIKLRSGKKIVELHISKLPSLNELLEKLDRL